MPPKTEQKDKNADPKSKDGKKDDGKKDDGKGPKNLANDDGKDSDQSCTAFAKALIYIVPIALYIPWAYRMFKGQPCCPEIPKPPPTAGPTCANISKHGKPKWPKGPGRGKSQTGEGCCGEGEASECQGGIPKECQEERCPEQDDCGKKNRQCLEKCLDKCLSKDGGRGKAGKRKEKKRNDDCEDEDDL